MPWEKSFDLDVATDKAMAVFWAKGYEATSMSDLISSMGINKGSLYNAFGSKKALFQRALLQYDRANRQKVLTELATIADPVEAIQALFDGLIAESIGDADCRGCFIINTALDMPNQPVDIQDFVSESLGAIEGFLTESVAKGQSMGRIPEALDAAETGKGLMALVIGIRVLARGSFDEAGLRAIGRQAMALIGNPQPVGSP